MGYTTGKQKKKPVAKRPHARKPGGYGQQRKTLTPKQVEFLRYYCQNSQVKKSAKMAGVNPHTAGDWMKHPVVLEELNKIKARLSEAASYSLEKSMYEAEEAREFARETSNANAYVKAVELKAKLNGLLIEKHDHRLAANFSIQIEGVKGQQLLPPANPIVPIDLSEAKVQIPPVVDETIDGEPISYEKAVQPREDEDELGF